MKILLDHNIPKLLKRLLPSHEVSRAREMRWEGLANGKLLTAAEEAGFDLLITADKNMSYQQNLSGRRIAIRVLSQQQWPLLRLHIHLVVAALDAVSPGSFAVIEIPTI